MDAKKIVWPLSIAELVEFLYVFLNAVSGPSIKPVKSKDILSLTS